MKTGVWTKSVFRKLLQLTQAVYYGREYEEENRGKKSTRQKTEAPTMAVRPALKQPEEKCPDEKGWTCYYCGKEGASQAGLPSGI